MHEAPDDLETWASYAQALAANGQHELSRWLVNAVASNPQQLDPTVWPWGSLSGETNARRNRFEAELRHGFIDSARLWLFEQVANEGPDLSLLVRVLGHPLTRFMRQFRLVASSDVFTEQYLEPVLEVLASARRESLRQLHLEFTDALPTERGDREGEEAVVAVQPSVLEAFFEAAPRLNQIEVRTEAPSMLTLRRASA